MMLVMWGVRRQRRARYLSENVPLADMNDNPLDTEEFERECRRVGAILVSWLPALCLFGCIGDSTVGEHGTQGAHEIPGWKVSSDPVVRLGGVEATGEDQFTKVEWATRLSNGEILVLEQQSAELRFFDRSGTHLRTVGRRGDGPGEFSNRPLKLSRGRGDTVFVLDWPRTGIMIFSPDGQFLRSEKMDYMHASRGLGAGLCPDDVPIFPDGSVLGCMPLQLRMLTDAPSIAEQKRRQRALVRVVADLEKADTLGDMSTSEYYDIQLGDMIAIVRHPFGSRSFVAVGGDPVLVYVANNPQYTIEVWSPGGGLERVVERDGARLAATDELKAIAWSELSPTLRPEYHEPIKAVLPVPDSIPAIYGLAAGPGGELWVQREPFLTVHARALLDVFDGEGRFRGNVRLTTPLIVKEVGEDYILGIRNDEFDVPIVELYELTRGK